jgi:hypothetical protein
MSLDAVYEAAKAAIKGVPNAPKIEVFAEPSAVGIEVGSTIRPMGGTLPDGRILLFANNTGSIIDVHKTILHDSRQRL